MYARQFADGPRFRPASLGAALAINGVVVAALLFAAPEFIPSIPDDPIDIIFIPKPIPSPTSEPRPQPTSRAQRPQPVPTSTPDPGPSLDDLTKPVNTGDGPILSGGDGTGTGTAVDPPQPAPALVGAIFDPRYADAIEPPYPDSARDAGTEGVVKLRITIGADGRVKRAEPLGGDPVLTRAAVRHVLARWRFKPATRGGVPEESIRVMSVRFQLDS